MSRCSQFSFSGIRIGWVPLAIALSGALLSLLPWRARLEEDVGLGLLYALRGPEAPPQNIAIVGIDHESAVRLQASDDPHDWSRRLHAALIQNARRGSAELVAFNIFFSGSSPDPTADRAMAEAMQAAGNVVVTDYVKPRQIHPGVYVESVVEPLAELADTALATTPFLLPKTSGDAEAFLTFFGEERRATLPTLLFLAYSLRTRSDDLAGLVLPFDPELAALLAGPGSSPNQRVDFDALARGISDRLRAKPKLNAALEEVAAREAAPKPARRLLRSLLRLLREDRTRYFNHYGPARTFRILPYHELVNASPSLPAEAFKNKVLLVGYLDDFQPETLEGLFYTPYSTVSSVELAATALANLLEDKWVQPAFSPPGEALWLLVWGGALGWLAHSSLPALRGAVLITALGGGYLGAAWLLFRTQGIWLPILIPLGWQIPAALLASLALNYFRQTRREERMRAVIQHFIPVDVFSQLTRHEDNGSLLTYGRLTKGVCLATDAGRYTALAEILEPMALARLMNAYYEAIFEPVTRRGGWISDVIGDAMLAVWVDEGDAGTARHEALAAALEIRQAVRHFEKSHELVFPIRMGLHYGDLRIGYVGSAGRGEIRAVGDTVNTAAHLEALNKLLGSQILVSQPLLEGLNAQGIRPLGDFLLAGKSRPVSVTELVSGLDELPEPRELFERFREALALFAEARWAEAHAAFMRLNLQFPEDGPTRFYYKTCQTYLADATLIAGSAGISIGKSDAARLSSDASRRSKVTPHD